MENILSLPILIFSPIIALIVLCLPFFKGKNILIRRFSKTFACVHFIYTLLFVVFFENFLNEGLAFSKEIKFFSKSWIEILGVKFNFALDGVSLVLILLTSFIFLLAIIASKNNITEKTRFYYSLMFFLQMSVLGVFCSQDMYLFFMFWELELIPIYFLISHWGHGNCKKSAMKFVLYTFAGSLFMLLGILLLHFYNFAVYENLTADFTQISISSQDFPMFMQLLISILFIIGFAVKMPIVPFHTWLPEAHTDAPTPVSMILAAILLKMGAYGIFRFNMQLLPEAFTKIIPVLIILALLNIIYTALIAFAQTDLKKIIAYSSISNMGIVLLGLCSLNVIGVSGAVFHMLSHGVISAGLFMVAGVIYLRTKTLELIELGGLGNVMPKLMGFALIIGLASVGVPLLMGFVGEFLTLWGFYDFAFVENESIMIMVAAIFAFIVLILSVIYILKLLHKTFYSNVFERWTLNGGLKDITTHEFMVLAVLSAVIIIFGVYPNSILDILSPTVDNLIQYLKI